MSDVRCARALESGDMTADADLLDVVGELGADERRVLLVLARRLLEGQRCYGRLSIATDPRDWRRERALEIQDLLVYSAFEELKAATEQAFRRKAKDRG
jgi:hypothetical protein